MLFYMRSSDYFLGLPFNVESYALLMHLVANECDLEVGELVVMLGDTHIYKNHLDEVEQMLARVDLPLPKLQLPKDQTIDNFNTDTIIAALVGYQHHAAIKAEVAI
jgi:thymidylate synthase